MSTALSYLRLLLFLAGVLAGVQLPMFVSQYGHSLEAHYREAARSLDAFRDEADRYFGGDLAALIAHYHASADAVFRDGGDSLAVIHRRYQLLQQRLAEFQRSPWAAYRQALLQPVADVQQQVRQNYTHAVQLDSSAIGFGLGCGLLLALAGEGLLRGLLALWAVMCRRWRPAAG